MDSTAPTPAETANPQTAVSAAIPPAGQLRFEADSNGRVAATSLCGGFRSSQSSGGEAGGCKLDARAECHLDLLCCTRVASNAESRMMPKLDRGCGFATPFPPGRNCRSIPRPEKGPKSLCSCRLHVPPHPLSFRSSRNWRLCRFSTGRMQRGSSSAEALQGRASGTASKISG